MNIYTNFIETHFFVSDMKHYFYDKLCIIKTDDANVHASYDALINYLKYFKHICWFQL